MIGSDGNPILYLVLFSLCVHVLHASGQAGLTLAIAAAVPCALTIHQSDPDYRLTTRTKIALVLLLSALFPGYPESLLARSVLALNVACLAALPTRYRIPILCVALMSFRPDRLYPLAYAATLGAFMMEQARFREHLVLNLWALAFPLLYCSDATTTEWLRARLLCLLCILVYDRFDEKNKGL